MILECYNEAVYTKRLQAVVGTNKKEFGTYLENISCQIQPADSAISQDIDMGFGKNLLMFCGVVDIVEGDRVFRTISGVDIEYRVVGIKTFKNMGNNSHMEILIRIFQS